VITVLAGVNGAGKSSIGGSTIRKGGGDWYNPDAEARKLKEKAPEKDILTINGEVWQQGVDLLDLAIREGECFAFETTLGGNTVPNKLHDAASVGIPVSVWYCGLSSAELHIQRVAERVARGGHNIPPEKIRARYESSMQNLCRLAPVLHQLYVYDNSSPVGDDGLPQLKSLIKVEGRKIISMETTCMPEWAKPIGAVCIQHFKI